MRRLLYVVLACLLLVASAACGGGDSGAKAGATKKPAVDKGDTISGLTVTGKLGADPAITVKPALQVSKPLTEVVSAGTGSPVQTNKKTVLNISIATGKGKKLYSDAQRGVPTQAVMAENQFFKVFIDGLVGNPEGSRVAIAAKVKDLWGSAGFPQLKLKAADTVVFVIDVLSVEPTTVLKAPKGATVTSPADAPKVVESGGKVTGLDFSKAPKKPPTKLQVIPLVNGSGPAAKAKHLVTFNYYGAVWGSKKPFDSSFSRGEPTSFAVGVGQLIPAWDKVIPGLKLGSRVLIIAPPKQAYGAQAQQNIPKNSTLAFVVDVLGVDG